MLWQPNHFKFGARVTAGIECMVGSAMYFISTGISLFKMEIKYYNFHKRLTLSLPFPNAEALIIGRRNKTTIVVDESDGIDSA